jgi:alanyl-tRNA synthetase
LIQYEKTKEGEYKELKKKNVDFGGGVERTLSVLNGLDDNYESFIFLPIITEIEQISGKKYKGKDKRAMRIVADHIRAAVFILGDERGVKPGNIGQGYVLRRLIRRAIRFGRILGIKKDFLVHVARAVLPIYFDYQELHRNQKNIYKELEEEEERFGKTIEKGLRKFDEICKDKVITGKEAFLLFQSYGFPIEMTQELANEKEAKIDLEEYNEEFRKHQDLSRTASSGQFSSGLADESEEVRKLHTATHLLNEALRVVLGSGVKQKGSNITKERLRFDFSFDRKLTENEKKKVEDLVNKKISESLHILRNEVPLNDALGSGAQAEFGAKYPELVSVYTIVDKKEKKGWFSKEICTGPHVENTKEIGKFKILKEESVASGVRRIKASVD